MSSPCGKCNTCPCGTSGAAPPPQPPPHRPPPAYVQGQQVECSNGQCAYPQAQQQPHHQQQAAPCSESQGAAQGENLAACQISSSTQQHRTPHVDCTCTSNRTRPVPSGPQGPQADYVTCSRAPKDHTVPFVETRCTCREKTPKIECHCSPAQPTQQAPQSHYQPTYAHVPCGSGSNPGGGRSGPHAYRTRAPSCGHCRASRKKKCIIQ
ncbi:uncharacterized protein [Drosophila bipectinata]|uniref:uncharacterized protein n=1 Tax=Drosophila bipectinata TaxID=42026 RepID=UPI0007E7F874|nr:uncharacterized protein LOC108126551 [Drosophila bipectinata]